MKGMNLADRKVTDGSGQYRIFAGVGKKKGVRLLLDLHSNFEGSASVPDFFKAFQVFVGQPTEYPVLKQQSIMVKPGHETFIDLAATVLSAQGIRGIPPHHRKCFFSNEGEKAGLKFYDVYSYKSCVFECQIMFVRSFRLDLLNTLYTLIGELKRMSTACPGTCPA